MRLLFGAGAVAVVIGLVFLFGAMAALNAAWAANPVEAILANPITWVLVVVIGLVILPDVIELLRRLSRRLRRDRDR